MTMSVETAEREQALHDAFHQFNQASEQLAGSYQQLQSQIVQLSGELSTVCDERLQQLVEKERIADRLAGLLEALPAAVVVLDGNNKIVDFNQAAVALLGLPLEGELWSVVWDNIRRRAQRDTPVDDSSSLPVNGQLISITERNLGQEPGRILVLVDVTETRQLQERLNHQERLSAMGEMAAQLAHQIRTPLSSALLYTSHLSRSDIDATQRRRFSERLRSRLQHVERQINDMLSFSKNGVSNVEYLSLSSLLDEFIHNCEPQLEAAGAEMILHDMTDCSLNILGNRDALLGALNNLLTNALEHGADHVEVTLSYAENDLERVSIRVKDNGSGVPVDLQDRLFEPFFTTRSDGTGLGLAVVQNVLLHHQGEVKLEQTSEPGAAFCLLLPIVHEHNSSQMMAGQIHVRRIQ
ncbi:MAG: ATP-binding protein [Candidatus Polarisedimenticolaceae bacterium]|nr:ATP-binding protein [Candidatus Polarisedimenticolaceae bacterium]